MQYSSWNQNHSAGNRSDHHLTAKRILGYFFHHVSCHTAIQLFCVRVGNNGIPQLLASKSLYTRTLHNPLDTYTPPGARLLVLSRMFLHTRFTVVRLSDVDNLRFRARLPLNVYRLQSVRYPRRTSQRQGLHTCTINTTAVQVYL